MMVLLVILLISVLVAVFMILFFKKTKNDNECWRVSIINSDVNFKMINNSEILAPGETILGAFCANPNESQDILEIIKLAYKAGNASGKKHRND